MMPEPCSQINEKIERMNKYTHQHKNNTMICVFVLGSRYKAPYYIYVGKTVHKQRRTSVNKESKKTNAKKLNKTYKTESILAETNK